MSKTNFFHGLESLQIKGTITLALSLGPDRQWTGSFHITPADLDDPALQKIPPLTFKGTSEKLGEAFFEDLKTPIQAATALFTNAEAFQQSVKAAEQAAKMNKPATAATPAKPAIPKSNPKYDARMKKVADLESAGKFGEAIAALPKDKEFPDKADELAAKLKELKQKHGGFSLFDPPEPKEPEKSTPAPEPLEGAEEPEEPEEPDFEEPNEPDEEQ